MVTSTGTSKALRLLGSSQAAPDSKISWQAEAAETSCSIRVKREFVVGRGSGLEMVLCRFQKLSLYSWAGGSGCTVLTEAHELLQISKIKRKGESDSEWALRRAKAVDEVNTRLLTLIHALVQVKPVVITDLPRHLMSTVPMCCPCTSLDERVPLW